MGKLRQENGIFPKGTSCGGQSPKLSASAARTLCNLGFLPRTDPKENPKNWDVGRDIGAIPGRCPSHRRGNSRHGKVLGKIARTLANTPRRAWVSAAPRQALSKEIQSGAGAGAGATQPRGPALFCSNAETLKKARNLLFCLFFFSLFFAWVSFLFLRKFCCRSKNKHERSVFRS